MSREFEFGGQLQISLTKEDVLRYASLYVDDQDDKLGVLLLAAKKRGFMTKDDLVAVARWKWPGGRTRQLVSENPEDDIKEITRASFSAHSERLRIGALLSLRGVQWPMASVILHFAFPDSYPILDIRAMNTVGGTTNYNFEKWIEYVKLCVEKARQLGVTLRELDKALWTFDKERMGDAVGQGS